MPQLAVDAISFFRVKSLAHTLECSNDKSESSEQKLPDRLYILCVGTSANPLTENEMEMARKYFSRITVEFCRLCDAENLQDGEYAAREHLIHSIEWRMNTKDVLAAALLLLNAIYNDLLIKQDASKGSVFALKFTDYNAIREDICAKMLHSLESQLEATEINDINKHIHIQDYLLDAIRLYPSCRSLPIIGYERVANAVGRYKLTFVERIRKISITTDYSIGKILSELFGERENRPLTEWLREKIIESGLRDICGEVVKGKRMWIEDIFLKNFTFIDLQQTLPEKITETREKFHSKADEANKAVLGLLQSHFATRSSSIVHIYDGLSEYFDYWNKYIEAYATEMLWEKMAEILHSVVIQVRQNHSDLDVASSVLKNCRIHQTALSFSFLLRNSYKEQIQSIDALRDKISNYFCSPYFNETDIISIIQSANSFYAKTIGSYVDHRCYPEFHLFVHEGIPRQDNISEHTTKFMWNIHYCPFIPKCLAYELQIYSCVTGGIDA